MIEPTALFEQHRPRLFGIAYRMLGSVSDAQDLVQESYLRWQQAEGDAIRSPQAWLTTVVTRLCLNHLQRARVKRETYVGPWLPEPLVDETADDPAEAAQRADSLSLAFLVLLESLSPTERAVFILREGFGCDFSEIARVVEKTEANCRQILVRARKRVDERRPHFALSADAAKVVEPYVAALKSGNLAALLEHLAEDVVLVADAGGRPGALLQPIQGSRTVAHAMLHAIQKHGIAAHELCAARVNGLPGFVRFQEGRAEAVLAFGVANGRIQAVFVVSNPEKLRHLHRAPSDPDLRHP